MLGQVMRLSSFKALSRRVDHVTPGVQASLVTGHQALTGGTTVLAVLAALASLSLGACTGAPTSAPADPATSSTALSDASAAPVAPAASDPERKRVPTPVPRAASAAR